MSLNTLKMMNKIIKRLSKIKQKIKSKMKNKNKLGEKKEEHLNLKKKLYKMTPIKRGQKENTDQKLKGKSKEEEEEEVVEEEEVEEEEDSTKEKKMEMMKVLLKFKKKMRIKEELEVEEVDTKEIIRVIEEEIEVDMKKNLIEGVDHRLQTKINLKLNKTMLNEIFE
jgi:hypothetical protein